MRKRHISRRALVKALGTTALPFPLIARAAWPDKPIRLIVHSQAGGGPDILCRILATELTKSMGQPFVIDNKPGAGGNIGMMEIVRSQPDGYTFGYANVGTLAINKSLYKPLPYDVEKQLLPVALLGYSQNVLVVNNSLPVKSVAELVALAKARPGKLTMGSAGNATTGHLGGELFKSMTGTFMVHVPYRGSPSAIQDLIGGQIDLMFDNVGSIMPHVQSGRVRILGVSGRSRSPVFPQVPTITEAGVLGYETTTWGGIVAPMGTPRELITRLNTEINRALGSPAISQMARATAFETVIGPPERLFDRALRETRLWADVIRRSGARID